MKKYNYIGLEELIKKAYEKKDNPIIMIMDKVKDPHNVGSILRNVEAFDIDGVIMGQHEQALINATVHKTSAGSTFNTDVCLVNNINNAIKTLKEKGF